MSKAAKETLFSTLFSYLGVCLGAFYSIFIIPKLFAQQADNYGALLFLLNYAGLFLILSSLATPLSVIKFYPLYAQKKREELLSFLLLLNFLGICISFCIFFFYSRLHPVSINIEGTTIDISFFFYPLLFCMTFFSFFESYCHALLKITVPAFLNNTFTRFWLFAILLLYYYNLIDFYTFTFLYFGQFATSFIALFFFVQSIKKDAICFQFVIPKDYKKILRYALFALPATSAAVLIAKIDIQMIGSLLGKTQVVYYNYAIFFMTVLLIPKNTLMQTARSLISRDFQTQTFEVFTPKYHKISNAFLLVTLIIFLGIAINIEELMLLLGSTFGNVEVKYAILILGVGRVLEAALISNHAVLEYSSHYKMILLFETFALVLLIALNFILIPACGIIGAALSSAFIFITNAVAKSIFIYCKFHLIPIKSSQIPSILCICSLSLLYWLPLDGLKIFSLNSGNLLLTIACRSLLLGLSLWGIMEFLGLRKLFVHLAKNKG